MSASVQIDEYNGSGATQTTNISNTNMGSNDSVNLNPVTYPVTPGNNTFEKWQKIDVTSMGGSSQINDLRVWRTGALGGSATHVTNARTTSYAGAASFTTPTASASTFTQTMPTSDPGAANLGIGGSLTGAITSAALSDYFVHQIQTNSGDTAGSTSTMNYQYDETA